MRCFAYGSNLDAQDWLRHCAERGVASDGLRPAGPAVLPDMTLLFDYFAVSRGGGVANIAPRVGHLVHGALFEVDAPTWRILDDKESAPSRYARTQRTAILPGGSHEPVVVYEVVPERRGAFTAPTRDYLDAVRRGYVRFGLPLDVLERAATGDAPLPCVQGFFCADAQARPMLQHAERAGISLHESLPAVSAEGVHGVLYRFDDLPAALRTLDAAAGAADVRTLVMVTRADARVERAWSHTTAPAVR